MENDLAIPYAANLDEDEQRAFRARMWALLARRARWETMGDASSLRVEEAEELLRSIAFTLDVYLTRTGAPGRALLTGDLDKMLGEGQAMLSAMVVETKVLYDAALRSVRDFGNRSLRDTLRGIGVFFARYQPLSYAHQIPADIDYQLAVPVEESLLGVRYIREYLSRLLFENAFLKRFSDVDVRGALKSYYGDFGEPLVNLFEPIAACVIGLSVLKDDITSLLITKARLSALEALFRSLSDEDARALLNRNALRILRRLRLLSADALEYLQKCALSLLPRIRATRPGGLSGIFPMRGDDDALPPFCP